MHTKTPINWIAFIVAQIKEKSTPFIKIKIFSPKTLKNAPRCVKIVTSFFVEVAMSEKNNTGKLFFVLSMLIFSTVGVVRRFVPLPSGLISAVRGILGSLTLLLIVLVWKKKISTKNLAKKLPWLIMTGIFIGINWMLLFESYNYTSVAVATLCYYLAPSFVILASPLVLGERLTKMKVLSLVLSLLGMVLVSGVVESGFSLSGDNFIGVALATGAALFYATVILSNKKIQGVDSNTLTIVELFSAGIAILPYAIFAETFAFADLTPLAIVLLLVLGIVHTGLAYSLYFGSLPKLSATTVAVLGYIDPIVAILLSALLLKEPMTPLTIVGAVLILGATFLADMKKSEK